MQITRNIKIDIPDLKMNQSHLNYMAQQHAVQFLSTKDYYNVTTLQARSIRAEGRLNSAKIHLEGNQNFITKISDHVLEDF